MAYCTAATLSVCLSILFSSSIWHFLISGGIGLSSDRRPPFHNADVALPTATGRQAQAINVRRYGARGDGVANDTVPIRRAVNAARMGRGTTLYLPPGIYLTDPVDCADIDGLTISGNGEKSTIKRRRFSGNALLVVGNRSTVRNLCLDGNKTAAEGSPAKSDYGLATGSECTIDHVTSTENHGHGFRANGSDNLFTACISSNNGVNPGEKGTADGYYVRDPHSGNMYRGCAANGNARSGFVITDNGSGLSNNKILECTTDGVNGYNEVNLEGSTDSVVQNCTIRGLVTLNHAVRTRIFDNIITEGPLSRACIYGRDTVEAWLARNRIEAGNFHERIYLVGSAPRVEYNSVEHSSPPDRGYSIFVDNSDASDTAVVIGNSVYGGHRGIAASYVRDFYDNETAALGDMDRALSITATGRIVMARAHVAEMEIRDTCASFFSAAAPDKGSFLAGDICWNTSSIADDQSGWVCIASGTPGTWVPAPEQHLAATPMKALPSKQMGQGSGCRPDRFYDNRQATTD